MRSWFRDLFKSISTQKLGGFDPYMNEYVLHSNVQIPVVTDCLPCDSTKDLAVLPNQTEQYCVNLGSTVGIVDIDLQYHFRVMTI